jgi:hypothetical protein
MTNPSPGLRRWSEAEDLAAAAERRCRFAARFLRSGLRVIDLGCGRMDVERCFAPSVYVPVDHVQRDARTRLIDPEATPLPPAWLDRIQVATMLGVIEYLTDPVAVMRGLASRGVALLASYRAVDLPSSKQAIPAAGRINTFDVAAVEGMARTAGYRQAFRYVFEGEQAVWLWVPDGVDPGTLSPVGLPRPQEVTRSRSRLVVAGFLGRGNCGDEAIFQTIHEAFADSHDIVAAVDEHGAFRGFWDWYPYDRSRISHQGNLAVFEQHDRIAGLLVGGGGLPCGFAGGLVDAARAAGVPTALAGVDLTLPEGGSSRALHDYLARFDDLFLRSRAATEAVSAVGIGGHHAGDWALRLETDRGKDLSFSPRRIALVVREEPLERLGWDFVTAIGSLLAGLRDRGHEPFWLPFCPEDERVLGELALLGAAPMERCWWNPRRMKQVVATSGAVVSIGRLHPLVFAASTRTPALVLAAPSQAVRPLPKLHDMVVELGIVTVATVAEALAHFDRGLPPPSNAERLTDSRARVDDMVGRLRRLFSS